MRISKELILEAKNHLDKYGLYDEKGRTNISIFDIDGTLLDDSDGPHEFYKENKEIADLARYSHSKGHKIVILTARPRSSYSASVQNLRMHRIPFHRLITNDRNETQYFKTRVRDDLQKRYNIIFNAGDRRTDISRPFKDTFVVFCPSC